MPSSSEYFYNVCDEYFQCSHIKKGIFLGEVDCFGEIVKDPRMEIDRIETIGIAKEIMYYSSFLPSDLFKYEKPRLYAIMRVYLKDKAPQIFYRKIDRCEFKIKEKEMKDTISIKELFEKNACKEGIMWFLDNIYRWTPLISLTTYSQSEYKIKDVIELAKNQNKTSYITWLKENGYSTMDEKKRKKLEDKLEKLEKEMQKIKEQL
jgi:hypothetical protein